jgi:hypothetical protein
VIFLLAFSLWASASDPTFSESRIVRKVDLLNVSKVRQQFVILDDSSLWVRPMPSLGQGTKINPTLIATPNFFSHEFLAFAGRLFVIVQSPFTSEKMIAEIRSVSLSKFSRLQLRNGLPYFLAAAVTLTMTAGDIYEGKFAGAAVTSGLTAALLIKGFLTCRSNVCSEPSQSVELLKDTNGRPYRIRNIIFNLDDGDHSIRDIEMRTISSPKVLLSEFLQIDECSSDLDEIVSPPVVPKD